MLEITTTRRFDKETDRCIKRGKDTLKMRNIMIRLASEETLEKKYHDHPLKGNWDGCRECHVEPNWLLIYRINGDTIIFEATGTHSDLFE